MSLQTSQPRGYTLKESLQFNCAYFVEFMYSIPVIYFASTGSDLSLTFLNYYILSGKTSILLIEKSLIFFFTFHYTILLLIKLIKVFSEFRL